MVMNRNERDSMSGFEHPLNRPEAALLDVSLRIQHSER